jgi:uncharacterized membrane protein
MYLLLKLLHVLAAFGLVTGLVGRAVTFRGAARAGTIDPAAALLGASHWFDARLVIPSFFGVAVTGPIAALAGHISWTVGGRPSWTLAAALLLLLPTPLIPTVLVPRRRRRETALHDAVAVGRITPELRAALDDRSVRTARAVEALLIASIVVLMVLKP